MTGLAFAVALVLVVGLASHAFHSWLRFRGQRSELEASATATLANDFEKFRLEVKTFMANARTR